MSHYMKMFLVGSLAVGLVAVAGAAEPKRHKKPHSLRSAATSDRQEKLVRAPGGVMVPPPAPPGRSPGFMDDGARKHSAKP